jgi:hypothetical protein
LVGGKGWICETQGKDEVAVLPFDVEAQALQRDLGTGVALVSLSAEILYCTGEPPDS